MAFKALNLNKLIGGNGIFVYKIDNLNNENALNLATIIVRSYNGEKFIVRALESILQNDYRPLEIIILYDRATRDNVLVPITEFIYKHKDDNGLLIKFIAHNYLSPFRSLQLGLNYIAKNSKYVFFLDYDNIFYPDKIKTQLNYMKEKGLKFSFCNQYVINENENKIALFSNFNKISLNVYSEILENKVDINAICISTDLIPLISRYFSSIVEQTYDWILEDWLMGLLFISLFERKDLYIDIPLGGYRKHSGNITYSNSINDPLKILKNNERAILTYMAFLKITNKYPDEFKITPFKQFKFVEIFSIEESKISIIHSALLGRKFLGRKFYYFIADRIIRLLFKKLFKK